MQAAPHTRLDRIESTEHLEDLLSEPTEGAVEALARLPGDLILLGVAGKMGPTLARMARRASDRTGVPRRIIGVARVAQVESAFPRESLSSAAGTRGQYTIEHINAALNRADEVGGFADAHQIAGAVLRQGGHRGFEHRESCHLSLADG